ncbi:2-hydroxyacid dehydrogenase [Actinotalea ferrariae]|uniref:2-hydroxyacid dehydrogenase n=1 Tax=Actinotalea ferrariae TaxID=1386098 RepID=UPI001C8B6ADD|nr:2-hydroxyacid dehydrogenase [Actinotalea ferrariae]MBX9243763.1 2-hydroxyacid dehydrogenase [Actinotalea ferrariae]
MLTVTVPSTDVRDRLLAGDVPPDVRLVTWDVASDLEDADDVAMVVLPNSSLDDDGWRRIAALRGLRVVHLTSAGYEHALPRLPEGVLLCNGRGIHDDGTAELAVGLLLASQRGIDDAVRAMGRREWSPGPRSSLADRRVMVVGSGSIGSAIRRRLEAFETEVVMVARTARVEDGTQVHAIDEVADLLPDVDVVVLVTPLTEETERLVDAAFLARMRDGALLVNVGRGKVVDTDALVAELEAGRLRAALDVTDPEPLPAEHPLWSAPGALVTPHVGGWTDATTPRVVRLLRRQLTRLAAGLEPENVVART